MASFQKRNFVLKKTHKLSFLRPTVWEQMTKLVASNSTQLFFFVWNWSDQKNFEIFSLCCFEVIEAPPMTRKIELCERKGKKLRVTWEREKEREREAKEERSRRRKSEWLSEREGGKKFPANSYGIVWEANQNLHIILPFYLFYRKSLVVRKFLFLPKFTVSELRGCRKANSRT